MIWGNSDFFSFGLFRYFGVGGSLRLAKLVCLLLARASQVPYIAKSKRKTLKIYLLFRNMMNNNFFLKSKNSKFFDLFINDLFSSKSLLDYKNAIEPFYSKYEMELKENIKLLRVVSPVYFLPHRFMVLMVRNFWSSWQPLHFLYHPKNCFVQFQIVLEVIPIRRKNHSKLSNC